jgi:hypothetical protein
MIRTFVIGFLVVLSLLACGCARFLRSPAREQGQAALASQPPLEQHGFTVLHFRAVADDYGVISVIGEIRNTGTAARGVELQAALRDADGRLVAVGHFCPASYKNIAPGETWPFAYSFGKQEGVADAELRIVGAFRTTDILNPASASFAP